MPTIIVNRDSNCYHTVQVDNDLLGIKAAQHLIERGISSVGMITLNESYIAMNIATKAFIRECKNAEIQIKDMHTFIADGRIETGYNLGKQLLKTKHLPQAIYCDTDSSAVGLLSYLNQHGISVPDDIQIISINQGNLEYTRFTSPSITVIDTPLEGLAVESIKIIEAIATHSLQEITHQLLKPHLYQRLSTKLL